jgi:hypothetical protein
VEICVCCIDVLILDPSGEPLTGLSIFAPVARIRASAWFMKVAACRGPFSSKLVPNQSETEKVIVFFDGKAGFHG